MTKNGGYSETILLEILKQTKESEQDTLVKIKSSTRFRKSNLYLFENCPWSTYFANRRGM